jgi:glyoxylase-like metal-dependent hydrolase (beta-lactamase superfamily II)
MVDADGVRIRRIRIGDLENNVYVVACAATGQALVVDASFDAEPIVEACAGLRVDQLVLTHGHHDHVGAADAVRRRMDVPYRIHPADLRPDICDLEPDGHLSDGERIQLGEVEVRIVHTPGHTPGSVCVLVGDHAITGDTLFPGGPGATRWDYSSFDTVIESIETKLLTLPDDTGVYPGHGDTMTTIGTERPDLAEWVARGW